MGSPFHVSHCARCLHQGGTLHGVRNSRQFASLERGGKQSCKSPRIVLITFHKNTLRRQAPRLIIQEQIERKPLCRSRHVGSAADNSHRDPVAIGDHGLARSGQPPNLFDRTVIAVSDHQVDSVQGRFADIRSIPAPFANTDERCDFRVDSVDLCKEMFEPGLPVSCRRLYHRRTSRQERTYYRNNAEERSIAGGYMKDKRRALLSKSLFFPEVMPEPFFMQRAAGV